MWRFGCPLQEDDLHAKLDVVSCSVPHVKTVIRGRDMTEGTIMPLGDTVDPRRQKRPEGTNMLLGAKFLVLELRRCGGSCLGC